MNLTKLYTGPIVMIMILCSIMYISCNRETQNNPLDMIEITDNWQFRKSGETQWLSADVPGTVHTDLLSHGIIEDFFYRMNEDDVQWIEDEDWEYRTIINVSESTLERDKVELIFKGLDTYAQVFLNDELILETNNMFVGWEVECKDYLQPGENELRILFLSPVREGMKKLEKVDYRIPSVNEQAPVDERTSVFTRKAPFHYGWDWGPRLVTSGIWRPVYIREWDNARIEDIYLETISANNDKAEIIADVEIYSLSGENYLLTLHINGQPSGVSESISLSNGVNKTRLEFSVDDPELWWTNGLGDPHLYDFSFRLEHKNKVIDRYEIDFGIRTVKLVQEPDEAGHSFHFEVNGIPVFMKGANIIPSETLTPRITEEMYQNLINNAVEANMNMLRVWGGAIYEEDYFYELCDRNGLLVWQDFMFACNLQPGDEAHLENIKKEAEYNVKRLRNHPSIALWCGNNENLHGWHHWGWQDLYTPEQRDFMWRTYERIFYEILPGAVSEFDPKNSYWSSSPSAIGDELADRKSGDEHDWTIWFGRQPFSNYASNVPRFVSEWGLQAFPGMHTIETFSEIGDWHIGSEVMRHRQRSNMPYIEPGFDGNDMIKWYMEMYYNVPAILKILPMSVSFCRPKDIKLRLKHTGAQCPTAWVHCTGN
jgi:beta-mannosidase